MPSPHVTAMPMLSRLLLVSPSPLARSAKLKWAARLTLRVNTAMSLREYEDPGFSVVYCIDALSGDRTRLRTIQAYRPALSQLLTSRSGNNNRRDCDTRSISKTRQSKQQRSQFLCRLLSAGISPERLSSPLLRSRPERHSRSSPFLLRSACQRRCAGPFLTAARLQSVVHQSWFSSQRLRPAAGCCDLDSQMHHLQAPIRRSLWSMNSFWSAQGTHNKNWLTVSVLSALDRPNFTRNSHGTVERSWTG